MSWIKQTTFTYKRNKGIQSKKVWHCFLSLSLINPHHPDYPMLCAHAPSERNYFYLMFAFSKNTCFRTLAKLLSEGLKKTDICTTFSLTLKELYERKKKRTIWNVTMGRSQQSLRKFFTYKRNKRIWHCYLSLILILIIRIIRCFVTCLHVGLHVSKHLKNCFQMQRILENRHLPDLQNVYF